MTELGVVDGPATAVAPAEDAVTVAPAPEEQAPAPDVAGWRLLVRRPTFVLGVLAVTFWVVMALFWPHVAPSDPDSQRAFDRFAAPSSDFWFGTDAYGRDVLSRVLAGSRQVLVIAPAATLLAVVVGTAVGLVTGYHRGRLDAVIMRLFDGISVFPALLPMILLVSLVGRSNLLVVLVIGSFFIPIIARTVRSTVLVERERQYVEAAKLRGESSLYVMAREILPNVTGPIVVEGTVRLAYAVFYAASLSFIGLGAPPGSPEWGTQVADNRGNIQIAWWTVLFPSLAIATLVVGVTLVADHLREVLDT